MGLQIARGDVWRSRFPYNDNPAQSKMRPIVILGYSKFGVGEDGNILVVPVSSFGDGGRPRKGDIQIDDIRRAGLDLTKDSWVHARRLFCLHPNAFDAGKGAVKKGSVTSTVMSQILLEAEKLFSAV